METGARYAQRSDRCSASAKDQREIIRRHLGDFDQRKTGGTCEPLNCLDIAHAPFRIAAAEARIERCVAFGGVMTVAPERAVQKKHSAPAQAASSAGNKSLGDTPRRNVNDIGAEHGQQFAGTAIASHDFVPRWIGRIDPLRRADIR